MPSTGQSPKGTMDRILRLMADKRASDVYLSAQSPAMIRINGLCVPINSQVLPPDAPLNLLREVLPPDRIEERTQHGIVDARHRALSRQCHAPAWHHRRGVSLHHP